MEYGQWCTVGGVRYMIVGSTPNSVYVFVALYDSKRRFDRSVVTEVSDFKQTDAERKALGYAF